MYFTQDDYRKIEEWLSHRTVKDSEFPEADPLDGTETFLILQDKKNKVIKLKDFINQDSEMKGYDIYNVSAELDNYNLSKFEAIDSIPDYKKKLGLIISYCTNPGNWNIDQFQGTSLDLWKSYGYWKNIHQDVLDLMGQPYGIATLNSDGKIDYADLEDIPKSKVGLGNVTNDAQVKRSEMGVANGVATLNSNGTVPAAQLPSYVDDVLEFNTLSALPTYGETGKIYVTKDTNLTYRWTGSQYTEISKSLALGETSSTAYAGNRGKENREALDSLPNNIVYSVKDFTSTNNSVTFNYGFNTKGTNNKYGNSVNVTKTIAAATTENAGVMSAADKVKLTGIEEGAQVNSITSVAGKTGQVLLNKNDVGLDAVDNTSDEDKPLSSAARVANTNLLTKINQKLPKENVIRCSDLNNIENPYNGEFVYCDQESKFYVYSNDFGWQALIDSTALTRYTYSAGQIDNKITTVGNSINNKMDKEYVTTLSDLDDITDPEYGRLVYVVTEDAYYYWNPTYNWTKIANSEDLDNKGGNDFNNTYKDILDNPWAPPISISGGGG